MSISRSACKTEIYVAIEMGEFEQVRLMLLAYPDLVNVKTAN